jgi:protein SCO1/2
VIRAAANRLGFASAGAAAVAVLLLGRPVAAEVDVSSASIEQRMGRSVRTELPFVDMDGRSLRLSDVIRGDKPVILMLAYYRCPTLCNAVLRGMARGLGALSLTPGKDYRAVTVSFDPRDTPEAAGKKRGSALAALGRAMERDDWPFLVGGEDAARALAEDLGFRYAYDPSTDQYAHPAVLFVLTADGRISRALDGVDPSPRDLRLALIEAGEGRIGSLLDRVLITCYRYDPASRRYGPTVLGALRLGGIGVLSAMGVLIVILWRVERRRTPRASGGAR